MENLLYITKDGKEAITTPSPLWSRYGVIIANRYDEAGGLLAGGGVNVVLVESRLNGESLLEHWEMLFGAAYFVIGEEGHDQLLTLTYPPLAIYDKYPDAEQANEMLCMVMDKQDVPNLGYVEHMTDGDGGLLRELVGILDRQFREATERVPQLWQSGNQAGLIQVIHRLSGKFSMLGMPDAFSFFNLTEKHLRENRTLQPFAYHRLLRELNTGLTFISVYTKPK